MAQTDHDGRRHGIARTLRQRPGHRMVRPAGQGTTAGRRPADRHGSGILRSVDVARERSAQWSRGTSVEGAGHVAGDAACFSSSSSSSGGVRVPQGPQTAAGRSGGSEAVAAQVVQILVLERRQPGALCTGTMGLATRSVHTAPRQAEFAGGNVTGRTCFGEGTMPELAVCLVRGVQGGVEHGTLYQRWGGTHEDLLTQGARRRRPSHLTRRTSGSPSPSPVKAFHAVDVVRPPHQVTLRTGRIRILLSADQAVLPATQARGRRLSRPAASVECVQPSPSARVSRQPAPSAS